MKPKRSLLIGVTFLSLLGALTNIYTTETYRGQRVQRFLYKGLGTVTKQDQGTVWPRK